MRKVSVIIILVSFSFHVLSQETSNLMSNGIAEIQNENFNAALQYFDEIITTEKQNIKAYTLRGYAKGQLNDFDGAISDFSKIIQLQPNNSDAYDKRGICQKNNNDYQKALKDYNKAIELDNKNASAYCNRAVLKHDFLNDIKGACDDWTVSKGLGFKKAHQISKGKCEEESGAIKTRNGVLLYFNVENNYHTLNLDGDVDLSNFPFIKKGEIWFQFIVNNKNDFSEEGANILSNYMNSEVDYLENEFKMRLTTENKIISVNGFHVNYWNYKNPETDYKEIHTPIIMTFFTDFKHNDFVYRFSYASASGDKKDANILLTDLVNNIQFYKSPIDLSKLQHAVENGENYYLEE